MTSRASTVTSKANGEKPAAANDDKSHDFFWTYTEEPHRTRRLAIIKAHPEVRDRIP
jgi:sphingolipid delta-4 desaturase